MGKKLKLKTNKSVKKRFKITAKGKVTSSKQARRHLLTDKPTSKKRKMRKKALSFAADARRVKMLLPYG